MKIKKKGHQQDGNAYGKQKDNAAPAGHFALLLFAFCFLFAAVSFLQTKLKYLGEENQKKKRRSNLHL